MFASTPTYSSNVVVFPDRRVARVAPAATIPDDMTAEQAAAKLDKLVDVWAQDDRFVMDQVGKLNDSGPGGFFAGRLDLRSIGLFGHSFGGASAVETCSLDARRKAAADLDGTVFGDVKQRGLSQPSLFLWSGSSSEAGTVQSMTALSQVAKGRIYQFNIQGTRHFNFSDYAAESQPALRLLGALGSIDGQRGLAIASAYLAPFFDLELKGLPTDLLDRPSPAYPEVRIGPPAAP